MSARWTGHDLQQPLSATMPCGESLEDTPLLASFDEFRVFGHAAPQESEPEWSEVEARALEALGRSRDLRLLAFLAAAALRRDSLGAFVAALTTAAAWLRDYWVDAFPAVEEDAVLRRNALNCLADRLAVVEPLRRLPIAAHVQLGRFGLRDLDIAAGVVSAADGPRDGQLIDATFASMPVDALQQTAAIARAGLDALATIDGEMRAHAGDEATPALEPVQVVLTRIRDVVERHLRGRAAIPVEGDARPDATRSVAAIASRDDAVRALEAVATFFRQQEPSSPIPLLLDRARRLVSRDFLEVLADIAPDALAQARATGGLKS